MIFVTVGTHEQQFNRLIEYIDCLAEKMDEDFIVQIGYSTYEPHNCKWQNFYSYKEMADYIKKAHIIITHGGPSSFIAPLQIGKIPIVIPRKKEFDEHVNNHQLFFCRQITERLGTIYLVEDVEDLPHAIENYDDLVSGIKGKNDSNNDKFCRELAVLVEELFEGRK